MAGGSQAAAEETPQLSLPQTLASLRGKKGGEISDSLTFRAGGVFYISVLNRRETEAVVNKISKQQTQRKDAVFKRCLQREGGGEDAASCLDHRRNHLGDTALLKLASQLDCSWQSNWEWWKPVI